MSTGPDGAASMQVDEGYAAWLHLMNQEPDLVSWRHSTWPLGVHEHRVDENWRRCLVAAYSLVPIN